mgnify:FL=1
MRPFGLNNISRLRRDFYLFVFTFLTDPCYCEHSEAMTKDVNTRDNNTLTHSPCHREPSQMAWRSRVAICRASREQYLLDCFALLAMTRVCCESGLLRCARNDKGGTRATHDKRGVAGALGVTCIAG